MQPMAHSPAKHITSMPRRRRLGSWSLWRRPDADAPPARTQVAANGDTLVGFHLWARLVRLIGGMEIGEHGPDAGDQSHGDTAEPAHHSGPMLGIAQPLP